MTRLLPRVIAGRVLAVALLHLCAMPGTAGSAIAQEHLDEEEVRAFVLNVQSGSLTATEAGAVCTQSLEEDPGANEMRQTMATFLEVSEAGAIGALCNALVHAIRGGEITLDAVPNAFRGGKDRASMLYLGQVMRTVYLSHALAAASADEKAAQ